MSGKCLLLHSLRELEVDSSCNTDFNKTLRVMLHTVAFLFNLRRNGATKLRNDKEELPNDGGFTCIYPYLYSVANAIFGLFSGWTSVS